jgi:hypothetical protein
MHAAVPGHRAHTRPQSAHTASASHVSGAYVLHVLLEVVIIRPIAVYGLWTQLEDTDAAGIQVHRACETGAVSGR